MLKRKYFDSISAGFINPDDYTWYEYTGARSLKFEHPDRKRNRRHDLVLSKGDVFGLREKRTGGWNLVKSDMMHIVFKMFDYDLDLIDKRSRITKKIPKRQSGTPGRSRTRAKGNTETRFKKRGVSAIREKTQINKADYQWRKVIDGGLELRSPANKPKFKLQRDQIVGLRFVNAAKGGLLVLESGIRTRISVKSFDEVMMASSVLDRQPKGTIDVDSEELRKEKLRQDKAKKAALTKPKSKRTRKLSDETIEVDVTKTTIKRKRRRVSPGAPVDDTTETPTTPKKSRVPRKRRRNLTDIKDIEKDAELEDAFKETVKEVMDEIELEESKSPRRKRSRVTPAAKKAATKRKAKEVKKDLAEDIQKANDFDIGDVIVFTKDAKQREYLVLDEQPSEKSDSFVEYTIFNLTEEPDYLQKFLQNTKGTKLSTLAKKVRVIKDLSEYTDYIDLFDVSRMSPYK